MGQLDSTCNAPPYTASAEKTNCIPDSVVGHGNTNIAALLTTTIMDDTAMYAAPTASSEGGADAAPILPKPLDMAVVRCPPPSPK
jgi:hypothetical protein